MLTRPRRFVVALTLVLAGPLVAAPVAAAAEQPTVPKLSWQPCGEDYPGFDCATARVPLDYDEPGGPTTSVALARKAATDPAKRIGSVFLNPGGPGGSGVEFALGAGNRLSQALEGRFDIVGFDPRGVGASDPLHCFDSQEELGAFFNGVPSFPYKREQERPYFDKYRSLARECLTRDGTIARHMSTADVVRDLDLLRRAVGDRKLNYLGFSYGSHIGNTYANMFPKNVRALVIDGVLDPRLWSSGWQIVNDRVATGQEFKEFLRLCDEAGPNCAFATEQGSAKRFEALARAVLAKPVDLGDGRLYTYEHLIGDANSSLYTPEWWPDYAAAFDFIADLAEGGKAGDGPSAAASRVLDKRRAPAPTRDADYPNGFDAYNGNVCADAEFPRSFRTFQAVGRYAEAAGRLAPYWWWGGAACADWPTNQDRYGGPWSTKTSAPVLVVGNYFDGVTSYTGAQASARLLKGSRLLSYAGWGHTAYERSDCVTGHVNRYLLTGALPPAKTVCPANPSPFLPGVAATTDAPFAGLPGTWPGIR
ncbi:alpha/beta hydrolase [Spirillospora sp. CA-294931]|uniref:alpha/beta hydrolase n=1 Tax=Spirillospora sp. CA-294931 TaxID=3240042 RepID=UPI003D8CAF62